MAYILLPVLTLLLLAGGVLVGAGGGLLSTPKGACCKGCGGKKACCDVGEPRKLGWLRNIQAARIRAAIVVETETRHAPPTWRATAIAGDCQTPEASSATAIAPFDIRLALAGGLAGGVTNLVLYPLDTLKTMRQSDATIRNMKDAFVKLASLPGREGLRSVYGGVVPAVVGSVSSSAIYFGTYEFAKRFLSSNNPFNITVPRPTVHMLAAASGNILSSIVFVPKDMVKQQMQARRTGSLSTLSSLVCADGSRATASSMAHASTEALTSTGLLAKADMSSVVAVVTDIYRKSGVLGFYPTFTATLARNIPSAVIRFTMYEEIRSRMVLRQREKRREGAWLGINCGSGHGRGGELTVLEVAGFVLAGSAASAFASTCCTPLDVVKTRIATGMIPPGTSLPAAVRLIYAREGRNGLFAGVSSRIVGSSLFGGIGFASFEAFKTLLGYHDLKQTVPAPIPLRAAAVREEGRVQ